MTKDIVTPAITLHRTQVTRAASMAQDTARLAMTLPEPEVYAEAVELNKAALQRLSSLQKTWSADWPTGPTTRARWPRRTRCRSISSMPATSCCGRRRRWRAQVNDLSELAENLSVSYGYWVSRQVEDRAG